MSQRHPTVSIGLPVYNGTRFIREAIESVLAQTFEDLELVIADNASTDDTEAICRGYAERDARVRYVRHGSNLGAAANYNHVFRMSRGRYFKWAAHDDLLEPAFIEQCLRILESEGPDVVLCFPGSAIIDGEGRRIEQIDENPALRLDEDLDLRMARPECRLKQFLQTMSLCHPVFGLIRAEALRRTRLIGAFHSSDVILLTELALQGRFHQLPEKLFIRRLHPGTSLWNKTPQEVAQWFDTARSPRIVMRHNRLLLEQANAIRLAPLTALERARCAYTLLRYGVPGRHRALATEWLSAGRDLLLGPTSPSRPTAAPA